jgi:hypothetical protein
LLSFYDLFGDARNEAARLLNEYTRAETAASQLRPVVHQQLFALYQEHVGDSRWDRISDAIVKAYYLNSVQDMLPGTSVHGENQATHSDSPLTDSMNSNQQEHGSGTRTNAEGGDAQSSAAMSFIAARALFQTNESSSSDVSAINSNGTMRISAEPN